MARKITQADIDEFNAKQRAAVVEHKKNVQSKPKRFPAAGTGQFLIDQAVGLINGAVDLPGKVFNVGGRATTSLAHWLGNLSAEDKQVVDAQLSHLSQNPTFFSDRYNEGANISRQRAPGANVAGEILAGGGLAGAAIRSVPTVTGATGTALQPVNLLPGVPSFMINPATTNSLAMGLSGAQEVIRDPLLNKILSAVNK